MPLEALSFPVAVFRHPDMPTDQASFPSFLKSLCTDLEETIKYQRLSWREHVVERKKADCLTITWYVLDKIQEAYATNRIQLPELDLIANMPSRMEAETDWENHVSSSDQLKVGQLIYLKGKSLSNRDVTHIVMVISEDEVFHCSAENQGARIEKISKVFERYGCGGHYKHYERSSPLMRSKDNRTPFKRSVVPYDLEMFARQGSSTPLSIYSASLASASSSPRLTPPNSARSISSLASAFSSPSLMSPNSERSNSSLDLMSDSPLTIRDAHQNLARPTSCMSISSPRIKSASSFSPMTDSPFANNNELDSSSRESTPPRPHSATVPNELSTKIHRFANSIIDPARTVKCRRKLFDLSEDLTPSIQMKAESLSESFTRAINMPSPQPLFVQPEVIIPSAVRVDASHSSMRAETIILPTVRDVRFGRSLSGFTPRKPNANPNNHAIDCVLSPAPAASIDRSLSTDTSHSAMRTETIILPTEGNILFGRTSSGFTLRKPDANPHSHAIDYILPPAQAPSLDRSLRNVISSNEEELGRTLSAEKVFRSQISPPEKPVKSIESSNSPQNTDPIERNATNRFTLDGINKPASRQPISLINCLFRPITVAQFHKNRGMVATTIKSYSPQLPLPEPVRIERTQIG